MSRLFRAGSSLLQPCVEVGARTRGGWGASRQPSFSSRGPGDQGLNSSRRLLLRVPSRGCLRSVAMKNLPYFCRGEVVRGFGRGSKELGIRTANFSEEVVDSFPSDISTGIYYGWGCVGTGDVHKVVLSIGWNPYYKNVKKSVETHVIHPFKEDFYGEVLSIIIVGYIRPEQNFDSLDALIAAIQHDIDEAKNLLDLPEHQKFKDDNFFHRANVNSMTNGH
ncbi:PREDICTED: riboflavin kinase [Thamnophis sirtalis]|uniref:Riboflavin kinase n=2 Tax=Thamnophis TaxID=34999 RepID=A0A6I9Y0U0_9SAUR|nr:PREDICTED: riboflavin kinase [Thamnophis sirtalis]